MSAAGTPAEGTERLPVSGLLTLLSLYFIQGLPQGFQSVAVPVILTTQGVAIESITLLSVLLGLPWMRETKMPLMPWIA